MHNNLILTDFLLICRSCFVLSDSPQRLFISVETPKSAKHEVFFGFDVLSALRDLFRAIKIVLLELFGALAMANDDDVDPRDQLGLSQVVFVLMRHELRFNGLRRVRLEKGNLSRGINATGQSDFGHRSSN